EARGLDYLILGNHFDGTDDLNIPGGGFYYGISTTPQELRSYAKMTVRGMETGDFLYLAHPDVVLSQYRGFDGHVRDMSRELCRASKALHVPLEYNLLGRMDRNSGRFRGLGYPCDRFWEIAAEEGVECIIGVDAHRPEHLLRTDVYDEAVRYLDGLGLKRLEQIV
ncbi:MAG: hypothetical protein Q4A66_09230, partial [Eubacteriales bacterium]|nr:hypothetical protein [Eubacteriales bacterium]